MLVPTLPTDLVEAFSDGGAPTREQVLRLMGLEAAQMGMDLDEALVAVRKGELPHRPAASTSTTWRRSGWRLSDLTAPLLRVVAQFGSARDWGSRGPSPAHPTMQHLAGVAQRKEHLTSDQGVGGPIPFAGTKYPMPV